MLDIMAAAYRDFFLLALMLLAIFKWLSLSICDQSALEFSFDDNVFASFQVPLQPVGAAPFCSHPDAMKAPWTKAVQVLIVFL